MYTSISLDSWDGETISPLTVAYNERYNDVHDMNFSVPERFAPMFDLGQSALLSWDTNKEFLITGIAVDKDTCNITTKSTEYVLDNRPAVPTVMATDWMDAEYPDGWYYGDELNDVANLDILDILKDVFLTSTSWYQHSHFADSSQVDLVSLLGMSFGSEVEGKLAYYKVSGSILDTVKDLLNLSSNRLRLTTTRTDHSSGYDITFGTRKCRDRIMEILVDNYRTDVKSIRTDINLGSTPHVVLRSDRDNVIRSVLYRPKRSYVTFDTVESSKDDDLSDLELNKSRLEDLVYEPYTQMSGGYYVEFEFHGNMDLTNVHPGDTVLVNTHHPRPAWVPEELMISEIVKTLDHTGYREYPTLVTPTASFNRDLTTTTAIKNSIQVFDGHSSSAMPQ